jgi:uncharacterized membrane protein YedE/YeeE
MALIGGSLIGLAAVWLFLSLGRVAGISGIAANALLRSKENLWPLMFVLGLGIGGWLAYSLSGGRPAMSLSGEHSLWLVIGGVLVGFGTRMGSGCTSGHGVCGMARLSKRSFAATLSFLAVGMATATLVGLL